MTLDRPKANAVDAVTSAALYEAFVELDARDDLRVGVLTGSGERFFCAGWDLKSAAQGEEHGADQGEGGFAGLTEYFDLRKPVIAAVNGAAYGGGVELMLACHLAVVAEHAVFAFPEAGLGILPDAGGLTRLPSTLPRVIAMELLLTGREFTAREAYAWGLANAVVPGGDVLDTAFALAQRVCRAAPLAVEAILETVSRTRGVPEREAFAALRTELEPAVSAVIHSRDAAEGVAAFTERRAARWVGR
ncbi:enoyl-CoA hydratase-related protein [Leucobacter japonicus]|uniref:enoyl-CoA hydratase-related protein n=1 Tax=Leucobacter japonicus TaxID=1461259 RepID=UPI001F4D07E0|nr:enoyl-CoA hydratase-related protein [Leucobacter japonicus]